MAWIDTDIAVSGETVKGSINAASDGTRIEVPFDKGISVGDTVTADGSEYKITGITNVGDRDETLQLEVTHGKSVSRRASGKSGR
jgi:uncharacterized Zn finger protein